MIQKNSLGHLIMPKSTVVKEWGLPYGFKFYETPPQTEDTVEILDSYMIDVGRWSIVYALALKINEEPFITYYSVGATEHQDEKPWQEDDEVTFYPAKLTTIERWVTA